jgi:hypothetical protein
MSGSRNIPSTWEAPAFGQTSQPTGPSPDYVSTQTAPTSVTTSQPDPASNHSELTAWLQTTASKQLSVPSLQNKGTMRIWLIDFERTGAACGVPLKVAAQSIYQYLPADISRWLHSKSSSSRMT